jgi:tetratricopeptide (TPR) repeat protein
MPRDYYPLIARAVAGLEDNTRDARDALYRRARAAQRVHFGSVADPAEVRGEHHALEDAIRTVESEFTPLSPSIDPARSRVQDDADQPSRLLGLPPDDAYRRAQRQRRRRLRLKLAIGVVVALLVIVTAGLYWRSRQQGQPLAELTALAEKYTLAAPPEAMAPGTRDNLVRVFTSIARGEAVDPRNAKALALLKSGDIAAAEALLKAVAEDQARRSEHDAKEAATAYRNLASIAALSDPARARTYFAEAAKLDPTNIQGLLSNAWFQEHAGQLDAAQAGYDAIVSQAKTSKDDHEAFWAQIGLGNLQQRRQDLAAALQTYQAAQGIAERIARDGSVGAGEQQESLAAAYTGIGDVKMRQGNLQDATASYRAALAAREQAVKADPNDAELQFSLGITYERIAGVALAQGNLADALALFRDKQRIVADLAKGNPSNTSWQRDLAISYGRVGEVLFAQENLPEALQAYKTSLSIMQPLAASDPDNAERQLDLSQPYERIGDALLAQGNLPDALSSLQMCLAIRQKLSAKDPTNREWQLGVWVVYSKLGDVLMAQQNAAAAAPFRRSALAIAEQLTNIDPWNTDYRRDLSISHDRMGDIEFVLGNKEEAFKYYQASLRAAYDLAKAAPTDLELQHDVVRSFRKLSAVYLLTNQPDKAREALSAGRGIIARLVEALPERPRWREELSWFDQKLATLK